MEVVRNRRWRELIADSRVVDAALVAGCLFLTALAVKTPWSTMPQLVIAVAGVTGSAAMWTRRKWPQFAALAGAAAFALSGNPGPWLVGLYSAAAYLPRRQIWIGGAAAWAGFIVLSWTEAEGLRWDDVAAGLLGVGLVVSIGRNVATRNTLLASLQERAERVETERLLRDEQARAAERTRIAREMHDVLAHKVSLIALYAGALELHTTDNARAKQGAAQIRATAREALQELRDVLGVLRADSNGDPTHDIAGRLGQPFADLAALVQASSDAGQVVELHDEAGTMPPATARVVYRVVQEGLTNARKHAPSAPTKISVNRCEDGSITVAVYNEASHTAPMDLPGSGSGLLGLAERIRLAGGSLRSGPLGHKGDGGWELHAVIPWLGKVEAS